jgi:hypothetical protein
MHKKKHQKLDRKVEWLGEKKVKHPPPNSCKTSTMCDSNIRNDVKEIMVM